MRRSAAAAATTTTVLGGLFLALLAASGLADSPNDAGGGGGVRHKPIAAGVLAANPNDIIAVYRPVDLQGVAVYVGRAGQGVQSIVFRDSKEAAAVFNELWDNQDVTKDPGEDDARPLTRMLLKDSEHKSATLILNVPRVLAMSWGPDHRHVHVHLDKLISGELFADPNGDGDGLPYLTIRNDHDDAQAVMAAYKACVYHH